MSNDTPRHNHPIAPASTWVNQNRYSGHQWCEWLSDLDCTIGVWNAALSDRHLLENPGVVRHAHSNDGKAQWYTSVTTWQRLGDTGSYGVIRLNGVDYFTPQALCQMHYEELVLHRIPDRHPELDAAKRVLRIIKGE